VINSFGIYISFTVIKNNDFVYLEAGYAEEREYVVELILAGNEMKGKPWEKVQKIS